MRLVRATADFSLNGISYAGFPLVLDDEMRLIEDLHWFLVDTCLRAGTVRSRATWLRYGRDMYDFFGFVLANGFDWKARPSVGALHAAESYRVWAHTECQLSRRTLNGRLRTVLRFYKWAVKRFYIDELPFDEHLVRAPRRGMLSHSDGSGGRRLTSTLLLREYSTPPRLLTLEQCKSCVSFLINPTHNLMFRVMLQTGLRNEEVRTFPASYVFDPTRRPSLQGKAKYRMHLSPRDMRLKGDKPRSIDVPLPLLTDLWQYLVFERSAGKRRVGAHRPELFLNERGTPFSEKTLDQVFRRLRQRVGFRVTPHMMRHVYATYTLHGLRERGFKGEALLYLRDRLGHASITTTEIYLELLRQLDTDLILLHERELNELMGENA